MDNNLKEKTAFLVHEIWAGWMRYLFSQGHINKFGDYVIPAELVERWTRQMGTSYIDLSEKEKESDQKIADEYINLINNHNEKDDVYNMKLGETIKKEIIPNHETYIHRVHKGWIYINKNSSVFVPKDS